jgi:hypothetical protein
MYSTGKVPLSPPLDLPPCLYVVVYFEIATTGKISVKVYKIDVDAAIKPDIGRINAMKSFGVGFNLAKGLGHRRLLWSGALPRC